MSNWIKLHRKLEQWEWYTDSKTLHLFIHLLMNANYEKKTWRGTTVSRGQVIVGRESLSAKTGISPQGIRTCLSKLLSTNDLTIKSTKKHSLVTICNYEKYQMQISETNQEINQQINQPINHNIRSKESTLTTGAEKLPHFEGKKSVKKKAKPRPKFKPPTLTEVSDYCLQRKNSINPTDYINFYESKGWMVGSNKMKCWKSAVRTWESRKKQEGNGNIQPLRQHHQSAEETRKMLARK